MDKKMLEKLGWSDELVSSVLEVKAKIDAGALKPMESFGFPQSLNRFDSSSIDSTGLDPAGSNHITMENGFDSNSF